MGAKRRSFNIGIIRKGKTYSLQEIAELFGIHINSVRTWVKNGLKIIDKQKPYLVHGSDLYDYLKQKRRTTKCKSDEFYCCRCRAARKATNNAVVIEILNDRQVSISGECLVCSTTVFRFGATQKLPNFEKHFHIITTHDRRLTDILNPIVNVDINKE